MKGWFNAYRDNSDNGPTFYSFNNRTSVNGDVTVISILVVFSTIYIAFLLVFPGIRKEKLSTFLTVTLSLFVGCSILVTRFGSSWSVSHMRLQTTYKAFSKEIIVADLAVYIGLGHVNITLKEINNSNNSLLDIDYNERFPWHKPYDMLNNYKEGIQKGLPFPILAVAEYFTYGDDGFCWGATYRTAGYYATIMLWSSFTFWVFMNVFLMMVPRYAAYFMTCCGILLFSTTYGYTKMTAMDPKLTIHLENQVLHFSYGWCFWIIIISGSISVIFGISISIVEWMFPNKFSTILEVDFDTPFDRHIIIKKKQHHQTHPNYCNSGDNYSKVFKCCTGVIMLVSFKRESSLKMNEKDRLPFNQHFHADNAINNQNFHQLFAGRHPIKHFNGYEYF